MLVLNLALLYTTLRNEHGVLLAHVFLTIGDKNPHLGFVKGKLGKEVH